MSIEDVNYYNDHRVRAGRQEPWFIEHDSKFVVVKVRSKDYAWLEKNDYSPSEFDETELKPMIYEKRVESERVCLTCGGHKEVETSNNSMYSYTVAKIGTFNSVYPNLAQHGFKTKPCPHQLCINGKEAIFKQLETPYLHPEAEDRVYRPYRLVAWPMHLVDCPTCNGTGRHVNPSIDAGGISMSEFDDDPDFAEDYFGGAYDVSCYQCGGKKKVPEINDEAMGPEDRELYEQWLRYTAEEAAEQAYYEAERAAEMRWGC